MIVLSIIGLVGLIVGLIIGFIKIVEYVFSHFGWLIGISALVIFLFAVLNFLAKYRDGEILIAIAGTLLAGKIKAILATVGAFLNTTSGFTFLSMSIGSLALIEIPNPGVNELISIEFPKYIWFSISGIFNWGVISIVKKMVNTIKPSKKTDPEIEKLKREMAQLRKENKEMNCELLSLKEGTQSKEGDR